MYPPHDNRPSTRQPKVGLQRGVDSRAGDVLSIYIVTYNTRFMFQTKK